MIWSRKKCPHRSVRAWGNLLDGNGDADGLGGGAALGGAGDGNIQVGIGHDGLKDEDAAHLQLGIGLGDLAQDPPGIPALAADGQGDVPKTNCLPYLFSFLR